MYNYHYRDAGDTRWYHLGSSEPCNDHLWVICEGPGGVVWLYHNYRANKNNVQTGYFNSVAEAKKVAENYADPVNVNANISHSHSYGNVLDLAACDVPQPKVSKPWLKPAKKEKEDNLMYNTVKIAPAAYASVSAPESDAQKKIDYLRERARDIFNVLDRNLRKQFKLNDSAGPKTAQEMIDAIKAGEFEIDEKKAKKNADYMEESGGYSYYSPMEVIKFTKFPGADREGYDVAYKALKAEHQKVKDIIQIKSADEALERIQQYEGWAYDKPTVH